MSPDTVASGQPSGMGARAPSLLRVMNVMRYERFAASYQCDWPPQQAVVHTHQHAYKHCDAAPSTLSSTCSATQLRYKMWQKAPTLRPQQVQPQYRLQESQGKSLRIARTGSEQEPAQQFQAHAPGHPLPSHVRAAASSAASPSAPQACA